jgi:hypothetical protein
MGAFFVCTEIRQRYRHFLRQRPHRARDAPQTLDLRIIPAWVANPADAYRRVGKPFTGLPTNQHLNRFVSASPERKKRPAGIPPP